jgi:hypothetical protein
VDKLTTAPAVGQRFGGLALSASLASGPVPDTILGSIGAA